MASQDRWVIVKSSDKTWSTGGENGKPLQYSCRENSMNGMKRQKDMTREDKSLMLEGFQHDTERVTGRKARCLQMEEIACKCQTFFSLLSGRRKQRSDIFPSLYKFKRFLLKFCVAIIPGFT